MNNTSPSTNTAYHQQLQDVSADLLEVNTQLKNKQHLSRENLFMLGRRKKKLDKQYNDLSAKIKALSK